jgi:L-idonate 5-dehydrogenase
MVVRLEQVAVCGSDLPDFWRVHEAYPLPLGGTGHEGIGWVEECPSGTYQEGERVLLWGFERRYGLFQERVLAKDRGLLRLPAELAPELALIVQLLGTVVRGLRKPGNLFGRRVVVLGQGPVGLLFNAALANLGAAQIIGVDLLDFRLEVGRQMGSTNAVNPGRSRLVDEVCAITDGHLADLVVEAVGEETTYAQALELARRHGCVLGFGVPDKDAVDGRVRFPLFAMQRKELTLFTTVNTGENPAADYAAALDWIARGRVDVRPLISHVLPFAQIQHAFELAVDKPPAERPIKVILRF